MNNYLGSNPPMQFMRKQVQLPLSSLRVITPSVDFKSNIVYSSQKEAFKMLNSNKIVRNEMVKTVEGFRKPHSYGIKKSGSMPTLDTVGQNCTPRQLQLKNLKNATRLNPNLSAYRKPPKIRIRKSPLYEMKRKTIKMDPNILKAGIARFILRKVSTVIPTGIQEDPFSKVINLPPMMGFETDGLFSKYMIGPPTYYWHKWDNGTWKPGSREQSTCVIIDGCLVLFGGLNGAMLNDVNVHNLQKHKWFKIKFQRNEQQPEPRYGHSAVAYKSKMYIFGGFRRYVESFKVRETYGDVYEFSTKTLKWDKINCSGILPFRRHHIAETIGKHMLIHGGIDQKSRVLDNIYILNLQNFSWSEVSIFGATPEKTSHHRSCMVIGQKILEKTKFEIFES